MTDTYPEFFVRSSGRIIPLDDAVWVRWASCGCATAATSAIKTDGAPILTEDAAFRAMLEKTSHPKDAVAKFVRQGFTVTLVTESKYIDVVFQAIKVGCTHEPKWGLK